ncbi:hypothetical protein FLP23_10070 [Protaetiibacter larvae]|uniref:Uncharacterized protein n=1 Tax=Protaetiibacter larvae TaxID=2592654 RepID=A0A5C1Y890_9MICO|nr:hypothetical protein FLP23_10070 [Protaetiibacter larvae]
MGTGAAGRDRLARRRDPAELSPRSHRDRRRRARRRGEDGVRGRSRPRVRAARRCGRAGLDRRLPRFRGGAVPAGTVLGRGLLP